MGDESLKTGKLDPDLLAELLSRNAIRDPRVVLGPGIGRDAAILETGERCLVVTSDPITFATDAIGWYAVHVNANDIATTGARPAWFLAALLLPEGRTTTDLVERVYADLLDACRGVGVELVGGHTEITADIGRPIIVGTMLGEVAREGLVRPEGAQPGDRLLLTKRAAIEGTAILARELAERLGAATDAAFVERCARFVRDPGISVLDDALIACEAGGVHAMHDPTEGGIATGILELSHACGCGIRVVRERIPVYPETARACEVFELDPLGLIASGSLLIAADPLRAAGIVEALNRRGIECTDIGEITAHGEGCRFVSEDGESDLPRFERDEIARLFEADA